MTIRVADRSEEPRVLATLTLAFARDPVTRYWWPEAADYLEWWPKFSHALGERGFDHDSVLVTEDFGAVSMWLPPGVQADGEKLAALDTPGTEDEDRIAAEFREAMASFHPEEPHWYLWGVGVDPARQGRGLGSALISRMLERVDADGVIAYLESSNPANVPLYERHGFEAIGLIEVADIPPLTPMIRRPR